ncbi:hypothetical protein MLD38_012927 [Melastoma candidum]|uniref:Uncharacterized protein n=1 Tax=Melastoma candidum TaxID=119954 RepID=A0ACB9RC42_9MYRT|nr:hypothetical protein MLD38_012927 [Melastoma candidum]
MTETDDSAVPEAQPPSAKKKRNLPGMPDPDAEVIALSPRALLATNRFVCEICNKGFQRDQNLQLHRRGHNLPWKLKHRNAKDPVRKKVYVCPEPTCVHHNPSRALGDLTGIKKHFCRKHGEKKWKCERCGKKYAVQSDWKAHLKTCGTKEYKCDCGTLFSRRDSFITHRAFCDALAEESTRAATAIAPLQVNDSNAASNGVPSEMESGTPPAEGDGAIGKTVAASPPPPPLTPSTSVLSPVLSVQSSDLPDNPVELLPSSAPAIVPSVAPVNSSSTTPPAVLQPPPHLPRREPASLSLFLSSTTAPQLFPTVAEQQTQQRMFVTAPQPAMSATALLQKAAQMGAAASNASFLRGLGLATSSSPSPSAYESNPDMELAGGNWWPGHVKIESMENPQVASGLGLGLVSPHHGSSGFAPSTMTHTGLYSSKPPTVDFLGLGMGHSGAEPGGLSALLTSFEGGYGRATAGLYGAGMGSTGGGGGGVAWDSGTEGKPNGPTFLQSLGRG